MGSLQRWLGSLFSAGTHATEADERLRSVASLPAAPLRAPPSVVTVAEVNEHEDTGEPILVPVIACELDTEEVPDLDVVYEYVAAVCERLERLYAGEHVRHFDVRFEMGPDRWLRSRSCRRVTVPPELVAKLSSPDYGPAELRSEIETRDNGDSVTPPVAWGDCVSYSGQEGGAGAIAAAGGATAAAGSGGRC